MKKIAALLVIVLMASSMAFAQNAVRESSSKPGGKTLKVTKAATPVAGSPAGAETVVVPEEYQVGEADTLKVTVWKEPDLSLSVVVRPDGKISLPLVNEVKVTGMTPVQIQTMLASKLGAYLVDPQVNVSVTEIRSKMAYVTGEVARPGAYFLHTPTTVLQMISIAGGFTPFAKRGKISIMRNENGQLVRYKFDYVDVVKGKKIEQNIVLLPGDTVVVP